MQQNPIVCANTSDFKKSVHIHGWVTYLKKGCRAILNNGRRRQTLVHINLYASVPSD